MKNSYNEIKKHLEEMHVDSPDAETRLILEHLCGEGFRTLISNNKELSEVEQKKIADILNRRSLGEPIQYILGVASFYNFDLEVNSNVLIPRPETEILVEWVIKKLPQNGKLLDIGIGSGTIGVTVAYERRDVEVLGVDVSFDALETARDNAKRYDLCNIKFKTSNLFSSVEQGMKFNVIAANLPYIPEYEYLNCAREVREFEPKLALVADNEGMELIYQVAKKAVEFLENTGSIIFELGHDQAFKLINYLEPLKLYNKIEILKDYNDFNRFVICSILS